MTNLHRYSAFWLFTAVGVVIFPVAVEAAPPAQTNGSHVLVKDVVTNCSGITCDIEIDFSPPPGRSKVIRRSQVESAIEEAGLSAAGIRIPKRLKVERPGRMVSVKEINSRVKEAIESALPTGIRVEELGSMRKIEVPVSGYEAVAHWTGGSTFRRRAAISVDLLNDGSSFRTIQVSVKLLLEIDVPVAVRQLKNGAIISPRDIAIKKMQLTAPVDSLAIQVENIVGRKLTQPLEADDFFEKDLLVKVPVIMRGESLTVHSNAGLIRISTNGLAREDGAVGDRIRVVVPTLSKMMWAHVIAPGQVEVSP